MKKPVFVLILCVVLSLCGCSRKQEKYQRISFEQDTMGEEIVKCLVEDTTVVNTVDQKFPTRLSIFRITKKEITEQDYQQIMDILELPDEPRYMELEENELLYSLVGYTDESRGYFEMTDEAVETLAWETFNKIPFIEGEFECLGIRDTITVSNIHGDEKILRAGVAFRRLLDGVPVTGEERCVLYFDGSGLVAIEITLFDYEKTGTMDVVALKDAVNKIKTPDSFSLEVYREPIPIVNTLNVDHIKLLLVNQFSEGCTILQPIYKFTGTASLVDGSEAEFSSKVIAIPESYTYEKDNEATVS